jgi:hypothetical protein
MTKDEIEALITRLENDAKIGNHGKTCIDYSPVAIKKIVVALRQLLCQASASPVEAHHRADGAPQAGSAWQPMETARNLEDHEILALSPAWGDGKRPIILRWFQYNGVEAWRDWDADLHFPTCWMPLPSAPSQIEERAPASDEASPLGENLPDTNIASPLSPGGEK